MNDKSPASSLFSGNQETKSSIRFNSRRAGIQVQVRGKKKRVCLLPLLLSGFFSIQNGPKSQLYEYPSEGDPCLILKLYIFIVWNTEKWSVLKNHRGKGAGKPADLFAKVANWSKIH